MSVMKRSLWFVIAGLVTCCIASCGPSVDLISDYDRGADFKNYKSYAFYKTGIDRVQISDLDKKRILRAIEYEMSVKGFVKSKSRPDILVNIFTTEREQVNVYPGHYWGYPGWGWGYWGYYYPYYWGPAYYSGPYVSSYVEGALYIDLIDARKKQLVWQGKGVGNLSRHKRLDKKERRIREFVNYIFQEYPPEIATYN